MSYENVKQALEKMGELEATISAYQHAMNVMSVDASTAAPADSAQERGKAMAVLSGVVYGLFANPQSRELGEYLMAHKEELSERDARRAQLWLKSCSQLSRIPQEEYVAYQVLLNEADGVWRRAKMPTILTALLRFWSRLSRITASLPAITILIFLLMMPC